MNIQKFHDNRFGDLTTLTNNITGNTMFIASEVGKMWGHTNMKQVVSRLLGKDEYMVVKKSDYVDFFKALVSNNVLPSKAHRVQLVTESALYKLALASNLEKSTPFRDWVTKEIIPSVRKTGSYNIASFNNIGIEKHTDIKVQKQNSKDINSINYASGGVGKVIEYNKQSCVYHTGLTPAEVKEIGRQKGLKSYQTTSGKETLRHMEPAVACAMSFTDNITKMGFDLKTASELSLKAAVPLFQGMIEMGIIPKELDE